jgi:hypothetical protein
LFTVREVEALIPRLAALMGQAIEHHRQATALGRELAREREAVGAAGGALLDRTRWKARAERLDGLRLEVKGRLQDIEALGGAVKDLALGLVDFPGLVPGVEDPVNLCWKHGEDAVRFWHGVDEGYAQRKPIPEGR